MVFAPPQEENTMAVTLELQFATGGWYARWHTASTPEFNRTREMFKNRIPEDARWWHPLAFKDKGGWWVAYGWLQEVSDLFVNYKEVRDKLEQPFKAQYEQRQEAKAHAEQEHQQQEQQRTRRERRRTQKQAAQRRKAAYQAIKKPTTQAEALAILNLKLPVTRATIKSAFRAQAQVLHPDHGGSHESMIILNAAYELALASPELTAK